MDNETTNIRYLPAVSAGLSTPCTISYALPKAVDPGEFAAIVTPLLTLVAPTGMTQAERTAWSLAAFDMLEDVSPVSLRSAVREAGKTVDHPSKIVPAIRKALGTGYQSMPTTIRPEPVLALPTDDVQADSERAEVASLIAGLARKLEARNGSN